MNHFRPLTPVKMCEYHYNGPWTPSMEAVEYFRQPRAQLASLDQQLHQPSFSQHYQQPHPHHHHPYQQPQFSYGPVYYHEPYPASSSRQMRNQAEKQRRDKLNQFINELAMLVPMVASSAKRLDKTSVLRLSATFLRMHQILNKNREKQTQQKQLSVPINWCQHMLEGMEGMLLVVTSSGKIVFISHTIESLLGHSQTDLLGQSLFNITSLEDHDELKKNLSPSEADDVSPSRPSTSSGKEIAKSKRAERRSFYLRLRHKSTPRGEQPQYETVHVMGHLRVPSPPPSSSSKKRSPSGSGPEPPQHMSHEVVLVAMMQPFKEKRITQLSLLEASREEWISRHLIDGTIVFSDHRISVVSGYMAEEVTGDFAFRYMHQDDVRWVLIALRQMYYRGESYGKSCYRLMSKTGEYIYIRTHGYLELSEDTHSVQSFVCINTLVSRDEGEQQIKEMKEMYTPMVTGHDSSVATFTAMNAPNNIPMLEMRVAGTSSDFLTPLKVDDPSELNNAIEQLLSDLPVDQIHPRDADAPVPDEQFAKCAMVSKTLMPPVHVHSSKLGVVSMPMIKKGPRYSRPSVITRAKEKRAVGEESLTAKKIKHETAESPNPMSLGIVELNRSVIKSRDDYMEMELGSNDSLVSGGSIQLARYATSPADSYTATSPTEGYVIATSPIVGTDQLTSYLCDESTDDPSSASSILVDPSTSSSIFHEFIAVDSLGPCQPSLVDSIDDPLQEPLESIGFWGRDIDSLEEGVARSHIQLNERMQFQDIQINAIEEDLSSVPVSSDGNHMIRSTFTHLKAEHRKQQQMLKTLKQDHQSLQQGGREQLSVRGAQDIGA